MADLSITVLRTRPCFIYFFGPPAQTLYFVIFASDPIEHEPVSTQSFGSQFNPSRVARISHTFVDVPAFVFILLDHLSKLYQFFYFLKVIDHTVIIPRLARQLTQLTICSSAMSRQVRHHPGSYPSPSGCPPALDFDSLMARELPNYCCSTLASSVGLTPTKLRPERQAATTLRKLSEPLARADYSALNYLCLLVLRCLLRGLQP